MPGRTRRLIDAIKLLSAIVAASALLPAAAPAADLRVTVTGVRSARGEVDICVFDRPRHFPNCHGIAAARHGHVPARVGAVSATFRGLAPGVYAVSAYHDENGNGRLDTSWLGIPTEGVGASENPRGLFGPPSFRQAAFTLGEAGGAVVVALVYP